MQRGAALCPGLQPRRLAELQPSIAATAAGSAGLSSSTAAAVVAEEEFERQLLPPLLDCWLQLMQQQQLLQPAGVLSRGIYAAAAAILQQQQYQSAAAAAGGPAEDSLACECCSQAPGVTQLLVTPGGGPCVVLDCKRCYCVSVLFDLLEPLAFHRSIEGWSGQLPAVLLLLEVLLRQVGPLRPLCSSSSSSSTNRVSRGCLLMLQSCVYACQVLVAGKASYGQLPPGGIIKVMMWQSAVTERQPPALQRSWQQLAAVMASFLKLCRCCGQQSANDDAWNAARGTPVKAMDAVFNGWAKYIPEVCV